MLLNLFSAIIIFASMTIPAYLVTKLRGKVRQLTLLLTIFTIIHGFYHVAVILGFEFVGTGLLEPLSVAVLIIFGLTYLRIIRSNEKTRRAFR